MLKKKIALIFLILLLSASSVLGIWTGIDDLYDSKSTGQISVSFSVCAYGFTSLIAIAGLLLKRKWTHWSVVIWAILVAYAAGGATYYFGETSVGSAILAAASTCLVSLPVLLLTRWVITPQSRSL